MPSQQFEGFDDWRKTPFCCCTAVFLEPVVEGVAVTGFLFFPAPKQCYQQSGDSTQEETYR